MGGWGEVARWGPRARLGAAVATGAVWSALWIGLLLAQGSNAAFLVASFVILAPVLGFLPEGWRDLGKVLAASYVGAWLFGLGLLFLVSSTDPASGSAIRDWTRSSLLVWAPAWLLAALLFAVRRRLGRGPRHRG